MFCRPTIGRVLAFLATDGPTTQNAIATHLGLNGGSTHRLLRRLARIGVVHIERLAKNRSLVGLDRSRVGFEAVRDLAMAECGVQGPSVTNRHRRFPDRSRGSFSRTPFDLDALFGSRLAGRALLLIRAMGGADVSDIADLLSEPQRPVVRRALRRFVAMGVVRLTPKAGLRRPIVLSDTWPHAALLAALLDAYLDAAPEHRVIASVSLRAIGGKRGVPATVLPKQTKGRSRGLKAVAAYAPFMPATHARLVALLAASGPLPSTAVAHALGLQCDTACKLGAVTRQRGLTVSVVEPFAGGKERWFALAPAAEPIASYLLTAAGPVRRTIVSRKPPTFPKPRPSRWRAIVANPGTPQYSALAILEAITSGDADVHAIARTTGIQPRRIKPHVRVMTASGIIVAEAVGNVVLYRIDESRVCGSAMKNLLTIA